MFFVKPPQPAGSWEYSVGLHLLSKNAEGPPSGGGLGMQVGAVLMALVWGSGGPDGRMQIGAGCCAIIRQTCVRLVPVTAPWQLTWTGTIWPGSRGDLPIHQLMGLTAGQLGKGIGWWELEAWGLAGSPAWGGCRTVVCYTQRDGNLKGRIRPPTSSLTVWRGPQGHGNVP